MFKLTILILCVFIGALISKPVENETPGKKFVTDISVKFSAVSRTLTETMLKTKNDQLSDEDTRDLIVTIFDSLKYITNLVEEIFHYQLNENEEEEVKIGFQKLKVMSKLYALGDDYYKWIPENFDKYLDNTNFCEFKKENYYNCTTNYNTIVAKIKDSTDSDEILFYWMEYREKNLVEAKSKMVKFIELLKKLGKKHENTAKYAWFSDYLDGHFDTQMENVMEGLEPLIQEMHAYVRYMLHQQYGDEVPLTGLIPHHLYEQAMFQSWKPDAVIAKDFKDVRIPIERNLNETAEDVLKVASNFMKSLGLTELPDDFWSQQVIKSNAEDDDCFPYLYDAGEIIYFEYCNDVSVRSFLQMHGNFARIYYANERKNLSFAYMEPFNIEYAVGEAAILAASTPKYLQGTGVDFVELKDDEDINILFRRGIHTILNIPEYFVHVKVIADVLDDEVSVDDLNKHYWDLMAKYAGVGPPINRNSEALDFPQRFYKRIENNQQALKFISEIMGYQIYEALCKKSGEYVKDDNNLQLHNCNFQNSKNAGAHLKQMMQLGAKKPWKQVLGTVTGNNDGMKADPILEYYKPLQKWLNIKNKENGVKIGW